MTEPEIQALIEKVAKAIYTHNLKGCGFSDSECEVYWTEASTRHKADPVFGSGTAAMAFAEAAMAVGMTLQATKEI